MKLRSVEFTRVDGRDVPMTPWPQMFYTSGMMWRANVDAFAMRPLTLTGLIKGVGRNFITMNYWRLMITLRILGLLTTDEGERLAWHHLTWRFWRHQMWWRLRAVRLGKRVLRWLRK